EGVPHGIPIPLTIRGNLYASTSQPPGPQGSNDAFLGAYSDMAVCDPSLGPFLTFLCQYSPFALAHSYSVAGMGADGEFENFLDCPNSGIFPFGQCAVHYNI